jgi:hypothetical protein
MREHPAANPGLLRFYSLSLTFFIVTFLSLHFLGPGACEQ